MKSTTAEKDNASVWGEGHQLSQSTIIRVLMVKKTPCQNETNRRIYVWFNRFAQNVTSKIFGLPRIVELLLIAAACYANKHFFFFYSYFIYLFIYF